MMSKGSSSKNETIYRSEKNEIDKIENNGKNNSKIDSASVTYAGINNLDKELLLKALRIMLRARSIDNKAMNLLRQGRTFFHVAGSGHEAVQAAVGLVMESQKDWFFPYYRDIALVLSIGVTPYDFFLQCFAKADDPATGGKQLSCHWSSKKLNIPTQSSPTGTQFLNAVGVALAGVKRGEKYVTFVSSGEGTTSQGEFHEAINWASREKLPVLFLIENNKYAISVHVQQQSGGKDNSISAMMSGYENLYRARIDGTDFSESYLAVQDAVNYIKEGKGPALIEAEVVRLHSHSSSDDQKKYRDHDELQDDLKKCPIEKLSRSLIHEGMLTEAEYEYLVKETAEEINDAAEEAFIAKDPVSENAAKYVYDESGYREGLEYEKSKSFGKPIVMVDAINHALQEEMERNDKMYIFGEDIADDKGGVFAATKGLSSKFGTERVFNSPLSESSIAGVATGMALTGLKPVVEIQFGDYIWPAFMQYKSEIASIRYRSNSEWSAAVVTRVAVGGYIHGGLYHSQNIESIFAHVPGIYIAFPSNAADAKGLLKTACRLNDPVIFCEHKGLYRQSFAVSPAPDSDYLVPFGKAKVVREGNDVTVVSYGLTLWDSIFAAKKLEDEGYSVEVIDLRTIIPLDEETIFNSVKKTNKLIVIHEDTFTAGFGAEIAARSADNCFQYLDGPVKRIAAMDSHIPYAPILENTILPSRDFIYKGIKELIKY